MIKSWTELLLSLLNAAVAIVTFLFFLKWYVNS